MRDDFQNGTVCIGEGNVVTIKDDLVIVEKSTAEKPWTEIWWLYRP